jgi:hypothetical protein
MRLKYKGEYRLFKGTLIGANVLVAAARYLAAHAPAARAEANKSDFLSA